MNQDLKNFLGLILQCGLRDFAAKHSTKHEKKSEAKSEKITPVTDLSVTRRKFLNKDLD